MLMTPLVLVLALLTAQPAGALLIVNKSADTLAFVDPVRLELLGTVPTGRAPHEVAVDPAGTTAYVSNYGTAEAPGSSVTVVDLAARRATATIDLGSFTRPHGIVVAPDGMVWVTCEGSRAVVVIDPKQGKVIRSYETGEQVTHMVVLTADGGKAFTANIRSNTVTMIDKASGAITRIEVGEGPEGIDIAPDGRELWVAHRGDGGLSIIDPTSGKVTATLAKVGEMPIRVKFTPDGTRVIISCARGNEIVVYDAKTRAPITRIPTGAMPVGVLVLPDGNTAFVANTMADKVTRVDLKTGAGAGSVSPGKEPDGMAWAGEAGR